MVTQNLLILLVLVFAFLGGVANTLLGWAKQVPPEAFDWRKFITSLVTAIIGAGGIAAVFNYSGVTNAVLACIAAFLSGAGVVSGISNVSGAVAARAVAKFQKLRPPTPPG